MPENLRAPFQIRHVMGQYLKNVRDRKSEEDYFAPQVFRAASKWIEENRDAKSFFMTVESFDPHEPWDPPEKFWRPYYDGEEPERKVVTSLYGAADQLTEKELKYLRANYAGEVTMVDHWLGKFFKTVRDAGFQDNTMIVVVSDHGHCVGEHNLVSKQGHPLCRHVADLVLMIRFPDGTGAGETYDALVSSHDIAPTIVNRCGLLGADEMDGNDLLPLIEASRSPRDHVTVGYGPFVMVRDEGYWYNAYLWGDLARLYYLPDDPDLNNNIAEENPDVVKRMQQWALDDAGGTIPESLRELAGSNIPGCTPMEAELDLDV
jgi:arylsulfatase A-like enzyme